MSDVAAQGRRLARWLWSRAACLGTALSLQACLVTDRIDYDRPNTPARVTRLAPEGFTTVPSEPEASCNGTGWMRFQAEVHDADIEDELDWRLIIDGKHYDTQSITLTGTEQRGQFSLCVQQANLHKKCVHVELLVSRGFRKVQQDPYTTNEEGDLGRTEWWLQGPREDFPEVSIGDCDPEGEQ